MTFAQIQERWSWRVFWFVTSNRAFVDQLLYIATFTIGVLMLRGAPWVWKCLLVLLGGYILNQTFHFGPNFRANKLSAVFFLMNVGIFLIIADQLAWKLKKNLPAANTKDQDTLATKVSVAAPVSVQTAAPLQTQIVQNKKVPKEISARMQLRSSKKHFVHFLNNGPWAKLVEISKDGIRVECITTPPKNIESKDIEFSLGANAHFRIRFVESQKDIFHFKFQELSQKDIQALNEWLQRQAA